MRSAKHKKIIVKINKFSWKKFVVIPLGTLMTLSIIAGSFVIPAMLSDNTANADSQLASSKKTETPQAQSFTTSSDAPEEAVNRDSYGVAPPATDVASYGPVTSVFFTNDATAPIEWPFLVGVPIGDGFGPRVAPCDVCSTFHNGVDFQPNDGAQIQAIADGTVTAVKNVDDPNDLTSDSYGSYVTIDHQIDGVTVTSLYAHLQYNSSPLKVGDTVKVRDFVGKVGQTGAATGPHLHFEIHVDGKPVDPMIWLKEHNHP